jgi:hypothetical protein
VSAASTGPASDPTRAFRERARLEADRYGPDPWIFVRELLQNSRDAGARNVRFEVVQDGAIERVTCIDDGDGMSFEHARRYLFSLYASSKEGAKNQAGRFGVGFWSILRFDPATILIQSRPRGGAPWGLRLDGGLAQAQHAEGPEGSGTVITLERARGDGRLEHRIYDAVWQSGRYLHHRDGLDVPVAITINGRAANAEFSLGAPSTSFRKRGLRGVVGLGPAPRVELFCRGLRVRAAASLEDLVAPAGRHTSRMRVLFPELPGGLAPQALLESEHLELLLSRSDARDNRALQRLVRLAQRELERLVERQLAHARPQPWWRRGFEAVFGVFRRSVVARSLVGAAVGGMLALGLSHVLWGFGDRRDPEPQPPAAMAVAAPPVATPSGPRPYRDLGTRYRGPRVDVLTPASAEPIALAYRPPEQRLYFAALTFWALAEDGSPIHGGDPLDDGHYTGSPCTDACTDVTIPIESDGTPLRVPLPTGHRIVEDSARLGGVAIEVRIARDGMPFVVAPAGTRAVLAYRTVPAPEASRRSPPPSAVSLPPDLARLAQRIRALPVADRVAIATTTVRRMIRYDHGAETALRHAEAAAKAGGFIARTIEIGAGDCDVQNALLTAILLEADVRARMAVGFVGDAGRSLPWLHAWVEVLGDDGIWRVADASDRIADAAPTVAVARPPGPRDADPSDVGSDASAGDPIDASAGTGAPVPSAADAATAAVPVDASPTDASPVAADDAPRDPTSPDRGASTPAAGEGPAAPPSTNPVVAAVAEPDGPIDRRWTWALRALPVVLLGIAGWLLLGGRMRRATTLDDSADLSRLLQGVLQQPGAFGHVAALFHRPLVPLSSGDAISLHRARELAAAGRLYRTKTRAALAAQAIRAGASVLDDRTPEGTTVADALGAVDIDRWSEMLERSTADRTLHAVNAALRERGENWCVRAAPDVQSGVAVLDLAPLGARLPGMRATRLVLLDAADPVLGRAAALGRAAPRAGVLLALDHVAKRLGIADDQRNHLLAGAARAAVLESFGG